MFYRPNANPEVRKMAQKVHDMLVVPATTARYILRSGKLGPVDVKFHAKCFPYLI